MLFSGTVLMGCHIRGYLQGSDLHLPSFCCPRLLCPLSPLWGVVHRRRHLPCFVADRLAMLVTQALGYQLATELRGSAEWRAHVGRVAAETGLSGPNVRHSSIFMRSPSCRFLGEHHMNSQWC